jgi:glycosyltransferase involved in cell wall biosynthesis
MESQFLNKKNEYHVSIIIPTYNHASYLGRALRSVINQTYTNWEAIVIDNHSTDNTDQVMSNFKDPRIKYLKINNDGVIAKSRNKGIEIAKGKWVAFLDSDDWWTSDKLKVCLSFANDNVDLIYHDLKIEHDNPKFFRKKKLKLVSRKNLY